MICQARECERTDIRARGLCGKHYMRFRRRGDPNTMLKRYRPQGFVWTLDGLMAATKERLVRLDLGPCREWQETKDGKGYGQATHLGVRRPAHRVAFILAGGVVADDQEICHRCDNPACIEPAHLFAGTRQDNMIDMSKKSRSSSPLTEQQAMLIIWYRLVIKLSYPKIGRLFGVSKTTARNVVSGKTWGHLRDSASFTTQFEQR